MEGQPQQPTAKEPVLDDPLAHPHLTPLAQISDFWKRYDHLADINDRKMVSNLNGNLDVLLIFVSFFHGFG